MLRQAGRTDTRGREKGRSWRNETRNARKGEGTENEGERREVEVEEGEGKEKGGPAERGRELRGLMGRCGRREEICLTELEVPVNVSVS